ncbi:MAG: GNAT family N-acetyltransferase [Bdellovibrionales bacterium]
MKIEYREELSGDSEKIFELNKSVFETDAEARLVDALRESKKLLLSMVAVADHKIVGHIAFSPMSIEQQGKRKLAGLGPMEVATSFQKQGVGSSLINKSEEKLKAMGYDAIFLLGHKEYYPKFGYRPSLPSFGIRSKYDVPDEFFMAKPISDKGLDGLSGTIHYTSEFDEL